MAFTLYIDKAVGETRAALFDEVGPLALAFERADEAIRRPRLGEVWAARALAHDPRIGATRLDLGTAGQAILPETGGAIPPEGTRLTVRIAREAHSGKRARVVLIGTAKGAEGRLEPGPDLTARLGAPSGLAPIEGLDARAAIDLACDMALAEVWALPGGGTIAIEPTRALTAIDIDAAERPAPKGRRAMEAAMNDAALIKAARALRLKGLGGQIVLDCVGRMSPASLKALADRFEAALNWQEGAKAAPVPAMGLVAARIPALIQPVAERLADPLARALAGLRALETLGMEERGRALTLTLPPSDHAALLAWEHDWRGDLSGRIGARFEAVSGPRFSVHAA